MWPELLHDAGVQRQTINRVINLMVTSGLSQDKRTVLETTEDWLIWVHPLDSSIPAHDGDFDEFLNCRGMHGPHT